MFSTAFHNGFLCSFSIVHVKDPGTCIILHSCVVPGKVLSVLSFDKYCEGNSASNYGYKPANKIKTIICSFPLPLSVSYTDLQKYKQQSKVQHDCNDG